MQTLREAVSEFKNTRRALAHFNISDSNQLHAIAHAAEKQGLPVIIGLSEGERAFFPLSEVRALITLFQSHGLRMYLNADHTYSADKAREAIDAGVDSIVVDGAKLPHTENVALVTEVVAYAKAAGREVLVEGELGYIGQSSQVIERLPEGAAVTEELMTTPEELQQFVAQTGVDLMAPAVGNVHGIVASGQPKLSISRIAALAAASPVPLVLHGGSGSSDEEFVQAIKAGIAIVHINTDLRLLYRRDLQKSLEEQPDEAAPYKILAPALTDMAAFTAQKMKLFSGL